MSSQPSISSTSPSEIQSPLTLETTDTITELFQSDPISWTDQMIDRMIAHYRQERVKFLNKPAKEPKAPTVKIEADISTDDLLSKLGLS